LNRQHAAQDFDFGGEFGPLLFGLVALGQRFHQGLVDHRHGSDLFLPVHPQTVKVGKHPHFCEAPGWKIRLRSGG